MMKIESFLLSQKSSMQISQSKISGRIIYNLKNVKFENSKNPNEKKDQLDNEDLDDALKQSSTAHKDVRVCPLEIEIKLTEL